MERSIFEENKQGIYETVGMSIHLEVLTVPSILLFEASPWEANINVPIISVN